MSTILTYLKSLFTSSNPQFETQTETPYTQRACRFRLHDTSSSTYTLSNGRKIGYAEWGISKDESPKHVVFALHGLPGNRLEGALIDDIARKLNVRVIIPERPGYGLSDECPGWTVLSHAADVLSLADGLGVQRYGVIGTSGGGPYAMGCAYTHPPERLLSVTNLCGMGETKTMSCKGMAWGHWVGYGLGYMRLARATTHWWVTGFFKLTEPSTRMGLSEEERTKRMIQGWDAAFDAAKLPTPEMSLWNRLGKGYIHDILRLIVHNSKEVWGTEKGAQAVTLDGANLASLWRFKVEDIRPELRVQLWYGLQDEWCPVGFGEETKRRLYLRGGGKAGKERTKARFEDETHMSIQVNWQEQIWRELVQCMETAEKEA